MFSQGAPPIKKREIGPQGPVVSFNRKIRPFFQPVNTDSEAFEAKRAVRMRGQL